MKTITASNMCTAKFGTSLNSHLSASSLQIREDLCRNVFFFVFLTEAHSCKQKLRPELPPAVRPVRKQSSNMSQYTVTQCTPNTVIQCHTYKPTSRSHQFTLILIELCRFCPSFVPNIRSFRRGCIHPSV